MGSASVVVTVSGGVVTSAIVISVISSDDQATGNQTLISKSIQMYIGAFLKLTEV